MYEYFDLRSSKQVLLYYIIQINIQCVSCFMVEVSSKQIKCLNLYLDESFNLWYSRHTNDTCIYTCRLFICISGSRKIYSGGWGGTEIIVFASGLEGVWGLDYFQLIYCVNLINLNFLKGGESGSETPWSPPPPPPHDSCSWFDHLIVQVLVAMVSERGHAQLYNVVVLFWTWCILEISARSCSSLSHLEAHDCNENYLHDRSNLNYHS